MSPAQALAAEPSSTAAERRPRKVTSIALVGPDGVGKSTVIGHLCERFAREFPGRGVYLRRWRPDWLPDLGLFAGKPRGNPNEAVRPRRKPGRFHFARILYYYWDFLIGGWWKDRVLPRAGSLVIYDRCALDMQVDPVRFALRSALGTRFIARFTPAPELVILLEDTPERISERKRELAPHEMREQLERWRKLARQGEVHAIVRVDAGAEEIAARVWQLIVDAGPDTVERSAGDGLEAIASLAGGSGPATEFAILPRRSRARFLAPLEPRAAAGNCLEVYNPQTQAGRIWRACVSRALRMGIGRRCFRDTVSFPIEALRQYLGNAAGCSDAVLSVSLGTPGVHRKPVIQVMDPSGRVRAFAKAGWNTATKELVQHEAAALAALGKHRFSTAVIPPVLDAGWFQNNFLLLMGADGGTARQSSPTLGERHVRFLAELHALKGPGHVSPMPAIARRIGIVREAGYRYHAHVLDMAVVACDRAMTGTAWPTGLGHGDFAPWNIRTAPDGKLLVLDWEYYSEHAPAAWDLFHYLTGSGIELERLTGAQMYERLTGETASRLHIERYFDLTNVPPALLRPLLISYLAEMLSSNIVRFGGAPSAMDRIARRAWAAMLTLAIRAEGASC